VHSACVVLLVWKPQNGFISDYLRLSKTVQRQITQCKEYLAAASFICCNQNKQLKGSTASWHYRELGFS